MRAALRLVVALSIRHLVAHRLRLALSAVGVASGVSLAVAVSSLGSSLSASLADIANAAASRANVEVRPVAGTGLDAGVADDVAAVAGVRAAGATVESFTLVRSRGRSERALLLGIDAGASELAPSSTDRSLVAAQDPPTAIEQVASDPLGTDAVFSRGPHALFGSDEPDDDIDTAALALSSGLAHALGIGRGDAVDIATPSGWRSAPVAFVVTGPEADRRRTVVTAIDTAQDLLGRPGRADVVYVETEDPRRDIEAIQSAVGTRGRVGPVAFRDKEVSQLLGSATLLLGLTGVVALFVGAFLVYNTMSMAAVERTVDVAVMRAVGARRRQVFGLQCAEGAVLGVIGSVLGIGGGVLLSRTVLAARGSAIQEVYPVELTRLVVRPRDVVIAGVLGVAAALVASVVPARRVARAEPSRSLGPPGTLEEPLERSHRLAVVLGLALLGLGAAVIAYLLLESRVEQVGAGVAIALGGLALLIRPAVPALARVLLRPLAGPDSRAPGVLRLAAGEVLRSPGRTAFTVGAVLLALSITLGVTLGVGAFTRTFRVAFDEILQADLYVRTATWRPFGSDVPLDTAVADEIRAVPGVHATYPFRFTTTTLAGNAVIMLAYEPTTYATFPDLTPLGRAAELRRAELLAKPGTVIVSPNVRLRLGYHIGDRIPVPTPAGTVELEVVGEFPDPSAITPTLYFRFEEFSRLWGTSGADNFPVAVAPDADVSTVKRAIERRLGARYGVVVDTREQYVERVNGVVSSLLGVVSSLLFLVVVTAGVGLANTLVISTLERRRDLGVLRAVGMQRRQLRRMVALEAVIVGTMGAGVAWVAGTALGWVFTVGSQSQLGVPITFSVTARPYVEALLFGTVGSVVAALYPAARAARLDVVEALQYE